ncbi:UNKNOWN [Stylonychia lemnae]|uniref:Cyclic nucleotide-binding domain-containing protein n=1 Tax=Stylonychia lemnae TaxID=5949 RepID=A0A077ZQJ1_STYLE|nr:UNKNOWN [Stylonychia lemnae]|eukprot:CDW71655.1 UNKNOWN [Stylonychia lemnae]
MYLHLTSCAWFYIINIEQTWLPPADYQYDETQFYQKSVGFQYWLSFYTSAQYLTSNDQSPHSNTEIVYGSLVCIGGALLSANLFGQLSVIVSNLDQKTNEFQKKIDQSNTAMKNIKLPKDIQDQVINFIKTTQSSLDQQKELDIFLSMVSPSLRKEVMKFIFDIILKKNDLFKNLSKQLSQHYIYSNRLEIRVNKIVQKLHTLLFTPEDQIIVQGDESQFLFFLSTGSVQVSELGLIFKCQRTASVRSTNYCVIETLEEEDFQNNRPMTELIFHVKQKFFQKDSIIMKQGEIVENIFIIIDGDVAVNISSGQQTSVLETLYKFCSFGSYTCLMQEDIRYSTCQMSALTDCTMLYLPIATFFNLRNVYKQIDKIIYDTEQFLSIYGLPFCDFKLYRRSAFKNPKVIFQGAVRRVIKLNNRNLQDKKGGSLKNLLNTMQEKLIMEKVNQEISKSMKKISQRQQRVIETKLLGKFTEIPILSDIDLINKMIQQQNQRIAQIQDFLRNQVLDHIDRNPNTQMKRRYVKRIHLDS